VRKGNVRGWSASTGSPLGGELKMVELKRRLRELGGRA
jgi:hypothetical protein